VRQGAGRPNVRATPPPRRRRVTRDDAALLEAFWVQGVREGFLNGTLDKRDGKVRLLIAHLRTMRPPVHIFDATPAMIDRCLDARRLCARSRYTWLAGLHVFYQWAIRDGRTDTDPTTAMVRPRLRRTLPRPVTTVELARAIESAEPVMRCWLVLAAYQGLRCQEIAGMRRSHVRFAEGLLIVQKGKGEKERIMPLHQEVRRAIMALPILDDDRLYSGVYGGHFSPNHVSQMISRYLGRIGVRATAHQLRHWFATELYRESGHDIRMVQELMGHESPITTAVYTDWTRPSAAAAVRALGANRRQNVAGLRSVGGAETA